MWAVVVYDCDLCKSRVWIYDTPGEAIKHMRIMWGNELQYWDYIEELDTRCGNWSATVGDGLNRVEFNVTEVENRR